jgi:hypothetical protein
MERWVCIYTVIVQAEVICYMDVQPTDKRYKGSRVVEIHLVKKNRDRERERERRRATKRKTEIAER